LENWRERQSSTLASTLTSPVEHAEALDGSDSGTTKLSRLDENIGAVSLELTADDLREIGSAAAKVPVEGDRYPEHLEKMTGRYTGCNLAGSESWEIVRAEIARETVAYSSLSRLGVA